MADSTRISEFLIGLGLDGSEVKGLFSGLKSQLKSDVVELQGIADKLDLFGALTDNIPKVKSALDSARAEVKKFKDEVAAIRDVGAVPTKELAAQLANAEAAARTAGAEFKRQTTTANNLGLQLSAAGVQTKNFAAEQTRLSAAVTKATADLQLQQSKDLLGFKSLSDVKPRIDELNAAFNTLKASGTLSATEIGAAQTLLQAKLRSVGDEVTGIGTGLKGTFTGMRDAFSNLAAPILAITAALAGVTAVVTAAVAAAREFQNSLGQIGAATNLTKAQLDQLGEGARSVAREFGFTVTEATKALFDIIRSGVPPQNSLEVVRIAAEAARAGFGTLDDAVKAADAQLSAFGGNVSDLRKGFDVLLTSFHNGGVSIGEFGANAGKAGNLARAAGIDFGEFVALLETLRKNGLDAGESFSALEKIITRFGESGIKRNLDEVGISSTNLVTAIEQIGARGNASLDTLLQLGLSSGKTAAAVSTLTNNAEQLPAALDRIANAAGATAKAYVQFLDTPAGKQAAFNAALEEATLNLGEIFGPGSIIGVGITKVLDAFNAFNEAVRAAAAGSDSFGGQVDIFISRLLGIPPATQKARDALTAFASDEAISKALKLIDADVKRVQDRLAALGKDLQDDVKAILDATARELADINTRTENDIAALDKRREATAATNAAIVELEIKASNDRFVALRNGEDQILKALQKSGADRLDAVKGSAEAEKKIARDVATERLNILSQLLAQWQQHYVSLVGLAQQHQQKLAAIDQERVSFNEQIEAQLFKLRVDALSPFDQYLAKVKEVERLAAEARDAGARGDLERAKTLTDQALGVAATIKGAISTSGAQIISEGQAQTEQVKLIKGLRDDYNTSLQKGAGLERDAATALIQSAKDAREEIGRVQAEYDKVKATFRESLTVKVEADLQSFSTLRSQLDELTKSRTVLIDTKLSNSSGAPAGDSGSGGGFSVLNKGGYVGRPGVQGFALGGPVFRKPDWSKVPGIGNADTVPALLREGSFVVRQAASAGYGDDIMSKLALAFADGGGVPSPGSIAMRLLGGLNPSGGAQNLGANPGTVKTVEEFKTARYVEEYATEVLRRFSASAAGRQLMGYLGDSVRGRIAYVDGHPTDAAAIDALLAEASYLGSNLPLISFVDKTSSTGGKTAQPFTFEDFVAALQSGFGFADGGAVGDTVPALLTPGEWVIPPGPSRMLGSDFLESLNRATIPRDMLARFAAPPQIRGFGDGGPVPGALINRSGSAPGGSTGAGGITVHINAAGGDLTNPATVRRVARVIRDEIERRSR